MLGDPVELALVFELGSHRDHHAAPEPRDFIEQLYLLEIAYAESFWASRPRRDRGEPDSHEVVGEWRHWLTRGGSWPLVGPPMPAVPARSRLRIERMEFASPWSLLAEIPPDAWKVGGATVSLTIATRLRLIARFVRALEELASLPGRISNAALEQQLRHAQIKGLIAKAELDRLAHEDALENYRRERGGGSLRVDRADLELPPTPEVDEIPEYPADEVDDASPPGPVAPEDDDERDRPQLEPGEEEPD